MRYNKLIPIIEPEKYGYWEVYPSHKIWHNNEDMKFKDYKQAEEKYNIKGGSVEWLNLVDGDNKIRIVSKFVDYGSHYDPSTKKSLICIGKENCECCQRRDALMVDGVDPKDKEITALKVRVQYLGFVIDRKDGKIKLLRIGHIIFKQIGELAENEEYAFEELPDYDITIRKTGQGLETKYSVVAARQNTELTKEELKQIREKVKDPNEIIDSIKSKVLGNEKPEEEINVEDINL